MCVYLLIHPDSLDSWHHGGMEPVMPGTSRDAEGERGHGAQRSPTACLDVPSEVEDHNVCGRPPWAGLNAIWGRPLPATGALAPALWHYAEGVRIPLQPPGGR